MVSASPPGSTTTHSWWFVGLVPYLRGEGLALTNAAATTYGEGANNIPCVCGSPKMMQLHCRGPTGTTCTVFCALSDMTLNKLLFFLLFLLKGGGERGEGQRLNSVQR